MLPHRPDVTRNGPNKQIKAACSHKRSVADMHAWPAEQASWPNAQPNNVGATASQVHSVVKSSIWQADRCKDGLHLCSAQDLALAGRREGRHHYNAASLPVQASQTTSQ
jgi:hypothetical protein